MTTYTATTNRELIIKLLTDYQVKHGNASETELPDLHSYLMINHPLISYNILIQEYINFKVAQGVTPIQTTGNITKRKYNKKNK